MSLCADIFPSLSSACLCFQSAEKLETWVYCCCGRWCAKTPGWHDNKLGVGIVSVSRLPLLSPGNPMSGPECKPQVPRLWSGYHPTLVCSDKYEAWQDSQTRCRDRRNMQICCQLTEQLTDMGMSTLTPDLASHWSLRPCPWLWLAATDTSWWVMRMLLLWPQCQA